MSSALVVAWLAALPTSASADVGDLDPTFSRDGRQETDFGGSDLAEDLAVQADGSILVAGSTGTLEDRNRRDIDIAIARYRPDGRLDPTFSADGRLRIDFGLNETASAIAIAPDGGILILSPTSPTSGDDFALIRLLTDGSLDPGFGVGGIATTRLDGWPGIARDLALLPDGRIIVGGQAHNQGRVEAALARFLPDGSLDPTFDQDGTIRSDLGDNRAIASISLAPSGELYAHALSQNTGGTTASNPAPVVARYLSTGELDPDFAGDGTAATGRFVSHLGLSILARPEGGVFVSGTTPAICCFTGGESRTLITVFAADGTLERTLEIVGSIGGMAFDPAGNLLVANIFESYALEVALFSQATHRFTDRYVAPFSEYVGSAGVAAQSDGRVVIAGNTYVFGPEPGAQDFVLARFLVAPGPADRDADGILDGRDQCPDIYAPNLPGGCTEITVTATLDYQEGRLVGSLTSESYVCEHDRRLVILRRVPGPDRRAASLKSGDEGRFSVRPSKPGRYYARVSDRVRQVGRCLADQSNLVRVP